MTKDEALDIIIHNYKNDVKQEDVRIAYCDEIEWNCGECPFRHGISCVNTIAEKLIERLIELEERPKGRWLRHSTGLIFKRKWGRCSECGNTLDFNRINAGRGDANFCPNCGADMRGDSE